MTKLTASPKRRSGKAKLTRMPSLAHFHRSSVNNTNRVNVHHTTSISISANATTFKRVVSSESVFDNRERMDVDEKVPGDVAVENDSPGGFAEVQLEADRIQTAEELFKDFSDPVLQHMQDAIISRFTASSIGLPCVCKRGVREYRCTDCDSNVAVCLDCILEMHDHCWFHWCEKWAEGFFKRVQMSAMGFVVFLGHEGECCPHAHKDNAANLRVVETNGIHEVKVLFCECPGRLEQYLQLVKAGLFPASIRRPCLAFTMRCLSDFLVHTHASRRSAFDHMKALQRKTNDVDPLSVSAPTNQFIRADRLWRYLAAERESGQSFLLDSHASFRPPSSMAEVCMACPIPGLNHIPSPSSHKLHLDTLFLCADGNFKLLNLKKNNNLSDPALWNGRGFMRAKDGLEAHLSKFPGVHIAKGDCSKFAAITNWNTLKYSKQEVSGVIMILCRHGCIRPDSAVNLKMGEKFIMTDYALRGALQTTRGIKRKILAYDIGCQYSANLVDRYKQQFPEVDVSELSILIGKMHVSNHVDECQWRRSFNYTHAVGRMDGEVAERWWSEANQVAGSTKHMNPGHRDDILDDVINDWNRRKMQGVAKSIEASIRKARTSTEKLVFGFKSADASMRQRYGEKVVKSWEAMNTEPYRTPDGTWDSVYRSKNPTPTAKQILDDLSQDGPSASRRAGASRLAALINEGLWIEHKRRMLSAGLIPDSEKESLEKSVRERKRAWHEAQERLLPELRVGNGLVELDNSEPSIVLPSTFSPAKREEIGLTSLVGTELALRQCEAFSAIDNLKRAIRAVTGMELEADKRTRNRDLSTRSGNAIRVARSHKKFWYEEYRLIRKAMLCLGMPEKDQTFLPLEHEDTYRPSTISPHEFGSGSKIAGWIWVMSTGKIGTTSKERREREQEDDRVQWFRQRAAMERWQEELELLEEEMRRLIRGFLKLGEAWRKALSLEQSAGRASFAAFKASEFENLAKDAQARYARLGLPLVMA